MRSICIMVAALATAVAFADGLPAKEAKRLSEQSYYVTPEECVERDICDIKEVGFRLSRFVLETKMSNTTDVQYGTVLFASVETKSHDTLEKYVFVQWVRGCAFDINRYRGVTTKHFLSIDHHNSTKSMCFPNWVIDRDAEDPVYSSDTSTLSRHRYAQWVDEPELGAYAFPTAKNTVFYGEKKPTIPKLGIVDTHTNAYAKKWNNGRELARSVYLEFRTCLYKETDVPRTFDETKDTLPPAIACYEWKSDFVYDEAKKKIAQGGTLAMCLEKEIFPDLDALQRSLIPDEKKSVEPVVVRPIMLAPELAPNTAPRAPPTEEPKK